MRSNQRLAWAIMLLPCLIGRSTVSHGALSSDIELPDRYAEAVLDVEGMI